MQKKLSIHLFSFILLIFLSACSFPNFLSKNKTSSQSELQPPQVELSAVLEGKHLISFINENHLYLLDPEYAVPVEIYQLSPDEIPINTDIFNIKLNPSKQYLIWYSPFKGYLKLDLNSKQTTLLKPSSNWLNKNPYFEFDSSGQNILLIDEEGTKLNSINLESNQITTYSIPEPFGNVFRASPNGDSVIFISGFGQTQNKPKFMFTTSQATQPKIFTLNSDINQRYLIDWLPDSSGVVSVENNHQIVFVPSYSPASKSVFFEIDPQYQITDLMVQDNLVYFNATDNNWRAVDPFTKELVVRMPTQIARDIHRPRFIPWYDKTFLIEEVLRIYPQEYRTLWLTNPIGVKKRLIEKYLEVNIKDQTPSI